MTDALVDELVALLRLERLEDNLFRGESRDIGTHRAALTSRYDKTKRAIEHRQLFLD